MRLLADFVLVTGFALTSVILFMLTVSKKRKMPQNILIFFLSVILLIIITGAASIHKMSTVFIIFNFFEDGARFVLGPVIFIYIKSIFVKDKHPIRSHLLHFIPYVVYILLITVPIGISRVLEKPIFDYLNFFNGNAYIAFVKDLYWILYIILTTKLFIEFKIKMKSNYSSFKEANFGWLKKFLVSCLLLAFFDLVAVSYRTLFLPNLSWDIGILSLCFLILLTIYLGYHGLRQSTVYLPHFLIEKESLHMHIADKKTNLTLSLQESEEIKNSLNKLLPEEKPYLEQELTLGELAELAGTSDKKLSLFLNHFLNTSFYDYINKYRVEEVKEKLKIEANEKYSLLGIAYTCGFNSKSSFYRAFKKETGISPTTYKNQKIS